MKEIPEINNDAPYMNTHSKNKLLLKYLHTQTFFNQKGGGIRRNKTHNKKLFSETKQCNEKDAKAFSDIK
jgi:hypothetical protein